LGNLVFEKKKRWLGEKGENFKKGASNQNNRGILRRKGCKKKEKKKKTPRT